METKTDVKAKSLVKEDLQKRIAELKVQLQNVQANMNGIQGAIMQCEQFIAELDKPEEPISKDKK